MDRRLHSGTYISQCRVYYQCNVFNAGKDCAMIRWALVLTTTIVTSLATVPVSPTWADSFVENVPTVDGRIQAISSSPKYDLISLVTIKESSSGDGAYEYTGIIFDPAKRAFIARTPLNDSPTVGPIWSPDGHEVAFLCDKTILTISKSGTTRRFVMPAYSHMMQWRIDKTHVLMHISYNGGRSVVRELDTDTGKTRSREVSLRKGVEIIGLFNVNRHPCLAFARRRTGKNRHSYTRIWVNRADDGKQMLAFTDNQLIPRSWGFWDWYCLDLSPDGSYFLLSQGLSGGVRNIIGRTADLRSVFRKPHEAIVLQDATMVPFRVKWPNSGKPKDYSGDPLAIVNNGTFGALAYAVNLRTGSRFEWDNASYLADWWLAKGTQAVVVTNEGLAIGGYRDITGPLLLRQPKLADEGGD